LRGQYEEAIAAFKRVLNRNPTFWISRAYLAVSYIELGREQDARAELAEVLRTNPMLSLEILRHREPYKDQAVLERIFDTLRKVELK
jgi:tetratricopeptide (TPR) repeat protein